MDGMHDLGGRQGFGKVGFAPKASPFQAPWEQRAYALRAMAIQLGIYNIDEYRHAVERMDPRHAMSASYYEKVITAIATLLVEKGVTTRAELEELAGGGILLGAGLLLTPCVLALLVASLELGETLTKRLHLGRDRVLCGTRRRDLRICDGLADSLDDLVWRNAFGLEE